MVGHDGYTFWAARYAETAPPWRRALPAVETLRQVWGQNVLPLYEGGARWRDKAAVPPGAQESHAPYDPEAHDAKQRAHPWLGYKGHLTESCDDALPHLITNVHTTAAPSGDNEALPAMHTALAQAELLPSTHLVAQGYVEAKRLIESREH
jgi:transposase